MVRHYFFFGPKPLVREAYNPLQKQAYIDGDRAGNSLGTHRACGVEAVQSPWLAWMMGGFHYARIWHFAVMWAILFFALGHLVMVVLGMAGTPCRRWSTRRRALSSSCPRSSWAGRLS